MGMRTPYSLAAAAVALGACYVAPSGYQTPPPSQYQTPPPPEAYAPAPQPTYAPPPQPTYAPPPQATYVPPPAPGYAPPEPSGTYVDVDLVPPADAAPSVDVFYDALAPYGRWEMDPGYGRVWIPSSPGYQPYSDG